MSSFNDPRLLAIKAKRAEAVAASRSDAPEAAPHCPSCGYSLRGLPANARCPECGKQPSVVKKSTTPAVEWNTAELERIKNGLDLNTLGWLGLTTCWLLALTVFWHGLPPLALWAAAALSGALFTGGAFMAAPPRHAQQQQSGGFHLRLPTAITATNLVVVVSIAALAITLLIGLAGVGSRNVASSPEGIAIAGLAWLLARLAMTPMLANLANLIADEPLGRRFWGIACALLIFGTLGSYFGYNTIGLNLMICIGALFLPFGYLVTELIFGWSLRALRRDYAWAIRYHHTTAARDQRLRQRMAKKPAPSRTS